MKTNNFCRQVFNYRDHPDQSFKRRMGCGALLLTMAAGLVFAGCSAKSSPDTKSKTPPPVPVYVAQAIETNVTVQLRAIGNVLPYTKVTIRSQITGQLKEVHFREGQEVKLGDPLFSIDARPSQGALNQAEANEKRDTALLENARIEFDRARKLFDSALISKDEFDRAQANIDSLKGTVLADRAVISGARLNVEFTSIRSPVDGVTGNLLVSPGNIVKAPDDAMLTINQIHPIYVSFAVPEQYLPQIKQEMNQKTLAVSALLPQASNAPPTGELTFIDNSVDPTTGMIQLKATFANLNNALWPGQFVQTSLTLSERPRVVAVPSQAVQNSQNGEFIFVVRADQTVELRRVKTGVSREGTTVVEEGLRAGETVVTDGQLRLLPDARVSIKSVEAPIPPVTGQTNS